jgi:hypothetical protein
MGKTHGPRDSNVLAWAANGSSESAIVSLPSDSAESSIWRRPIRAIHRAGRHGRYSPTLDPNEGRRLGWHQVGQVQHARWRVHWEVTQHVSTALGLLVTPHMVRRMSTCFGFAQDDRAPLHISSDLSATVTEPALVLRDSVRACSSITVGAQGYVGGSGTPAARPLRLISPWCGASS